MQSCVNHRWGLMLVVCLSTASVRAEAPDVTALFPAGGQRGTEVLVKLQGKVDASTLKLWSSNPSVELVGVEGKDSVKLKLAAEAAVGTVWLRFHNDDGASSLRPFLIGTSSEILETEPNNTRTDAQPISEVPTTINGTLEKADDVDTYRIPLQQGATLVAVLSAKQSLGSPMDALMQIVDAQGFVLEQNHDQNGLDPRLVFQAPHTGDYWVRVFAFPSDPNATIRFSGAPTYVYRLLMTTGPFIDHVSPCSVPENTPAKVEAIGWNLSDETRSFEIPPFATGMHPLFPDTRESTAKVLVTPQSVTMEQEPNQIAEAQKITLPGTISGVIGGPGDVDAWKFSATSGRKLAFRVTAVSLGSTLDAVIRIHDAQGEQLVELDDRPQDDADIHLEWAAPKDGDYFVTLTDRFAHGGPGYWYALSILEPQPAVLLQVAAETFTVQTETPLEIPVTIERRNGFELPLAIRIEGLPEGIALDPATSEPAGESSKLVKLVLKSTRTERWTGPIKILGQVSDSMPLNLPAYLTSPLTNDRLTDLWLTVSPK